jgi:hypothetical protein
MRRRVGDDRACTPYAAGVSRGIPTGETMDLSNLPKYWQVIDDEFDAIDQLPPLEQSRRLSARAFDEAQVAGPRAYMEVTRYLNVARENHGALLSLLQSHGVTVWAP